MDNFYKTAKRMKESSELLLQNNQYFNSCYTAGYVVECYAKLILLIVYGNTANVKDFRHELKDLKKEINSLKMDPDINSMINNTYFIDLLTDANTIVSGANKWHPLKRYSDDESIWSESTALHYKAEINYIYNKIIDMKLDGVIS